MAASSMVFFDLEMTGGPDAENEIISIGAVCRNRKFHIFIYPDSDINYYAQRTHGISKGPNGQLFLNRCPIPAKDVFQPRQGLQLFGDFLREIGNEVILVGHAAFITDLRILRKCLEQYNPRFPRNVRIMDTQDMVKKINKELQYKGRPLICNGLQLGLANLLNWFRLQPQPEPHNALSDARACENLFEAMQSNYRDIMRNGCMVAKALF